MYDTARRAMGMQLLALCLGVSFLMVAGLVLYGVYRYVGGRNAQDLAPYEMGGIVIALSTSLISLITAARVFFRNLTGSRIVIPDEDRALLENLIREANEKAIDQYVRLSSLSGATGTATKLGLTGLPLATVGLTIFFSAISIFGAQGFLDLAKLTLGAFIGSFVQRAVSGERQTSASGAVRNS